MRTHRPPEIDMTLDGRFRFPPRKAAGVGIGWPVKIGLAAALVAVLATAFAVAALAAWLMSLLLPVVVVAGVVAWAAFRFQSWRLRRSLRGGRDLFRM